LEVPKGTKVEREGKNDHEKGVTTLTSKDDVQEKKEYEPSKESKSLFPKPYIPPLPIP